MSGIRSSREAAAQQSRLSAQHLSGLAEPYRGIMYEALTCLKDIRKQSNNASPALKKRLQDIATRVEDSLERALPRAQHGSRLQGHFARMERQAAAAQPELQQQAQDIETELRELLTQLMTLRTKSYQVLGQAAKLDFDHVSQRELQDALFELDALEETYASLPDMPRVSGYGRR
jgi:chromosome segregation ATPase